MRLTMLLSIHLLFAARFVEHTVQSQAATNVNQRDSLTYSWIPPATYRMGCLGPVFETSYGVGQEACFGNELPRHSATLSRGFWLAKTPVTQVAYQAVMRTNPSRFPGDQLPVENVSWDAANSFCERVGMRLPTEAEWEYAARGGVAAERYGLLDQIAWYRGNSSGKTHVVGQKQPNLYGLYDMMGNVWEWVADWYAPYTKAADGSCCDNPAEAIRDQEGPLAGRVHAIRGGSWNDFATDVRMSLRNYPKSSPDEDSDRDYDDYTIGFRCAGN